ncbi:MAG: flagellar protein FlgN [Clostridia bacterium]|nr:flagellar protein FlgN [Clostridia bacterium]
MDDKLYGLETILEKQLSQINGLLEIAKKKTKTLMDDDMEALSRVCGEMIGLSEELALQEEKRIKAHEKAASELNLPKDCSFKELWNNLSTGQRKKQNNLKILVEDLNDKYKTLRDQNDLNKLLLKQSLQYAGSLTEAADPGRKIAYGKSGGFEENDLSYSSLNRTV